MDRKEIIRILLTIFVAVIFVASYASFGSTGSMTTTTTTSIAPQTVYGSGNVNGTVVGYGTLMTVFINCNNQSVRNLTNNNVSNTLSALENNNTINNFFAPNQSAYTIYLNQLNSYELANLISSKAASNQSRACLSFKGQTQLLLPPTASLYVSSQKVTIPLPANLRNYVLNVKILPINSLVNLRVSTLLTYNGTVFGNMSISYLGGS
ncbi:MAG: hypothetical protein KGH71_00825 [Candidatus Micrarchaeota archaeon]|nr:hypothetical protein [Candidatus Micrarchaeota archaeon]